MQSILCTWNNDIYMRQNTGMNSLCLKSSNRYHSVFKRTLLKLIIEVDGKHHLTEDGVDHDKARDEYLNGIGYEIFRIPGFETLKEPEKLLKQIEEVIEQRRAE